ncbi:MAG: DUF4350 domain-containing protein, partial [Pseudolysinimonas sp.]
MTAPATTTAAASAPTAESSVDSSADDILTATPGAVLRRRAGLLAVIALVLLATIVIAIARSTGSASHDPLAATNPAPEGSQALVRVLEQHGVQVIPTDSLKAARTALNDVESSDATVLVYDPQSLMTPEQHGSVLALGTDVVFVEPDLYALPDLAPGVGLTGEVTGSFTADCPVEAVQKAGTVSASGLGYRITASKDGVDTEDAAARDAVTCLTKKGASGLVQVPLGGRTLSILGLGTALQNGTIAT